MDYSNFHGRGVNTKYEVNMPDGGYATSLYSHRVRWTPIMKIALKGLREVQGFQLLAAVFIPTSFARSPARNEM